MKIPGVLIPLFHSTTFKDCFLVIWHISKSASSHNSVFLSWLTLTELHKRKIWPIFANKMLAEKRRGHIKTKKIPIQTVPHSVSLSFVFVVISWTTGTTHWVWNSERPVGQSWLHLNSPIHSENASQSYKRSMKISRCRICYV